MTLDRYDNRMATLLKDNLTRCYSAEPKLGHEEIFKHSFNTVNIFPLRVFMTVKFLM